MNITKLEKIQKAIDLLSSLGIKIEKTSVKEAVDKSVRVSKEDLSRFETLARSVYPKGRIVFGWTKKGGLRFTKLESFVRLQKCASYARSRREPKAQPAQSN